jgi:Arc/MetJ-type ribon-helix-helix transcriptional regulator
MSMKLSVSLSEDDVRFLEEFARAQGMASRSAALQRAVTLLRASQLGPAYADAWEQWETSGEAEVWEPVAADGLDP